MPTASATPSTVARTPRRGRGSPSAATKTFGFTLILRDPPLDDETWDGIYGRVDDATFGTTAGVASWSFDREAEDLAAAMRSAVADARAEGLVIERLVMDEHELDAAFDDA